VGRAGLEDADLLALTPGSPLLMVVGVTRDQRESPVEHSVVLYRPEHFRFAIESRRGSPNTRSGHRTRRPGTRTPN
jgi:DNA-binding GntR family transcriptional regulator